MVSVLRSCVVARPHTARAGCGRMLSGCVPDAIDVEAGFCGIGSDEAATVTPSPLELLEVVELLSLLVGGSDGRLGGCVVVAFCLVNLFAGFCSVCCAGNLSVLVVGFVGILLVDRAEGEGAGSVVGVFFSLCLRWLGSGALRVLPRPCTCPHR